MANEFIARKGLIALEDSQISGSLSVTGDITGSIFSGSFIGDGSQLSGIEGFPFTGSAGITGSLTVVGPVNATTFTGDGSQLTGIEGFPFTGSAKITGSLEVTGSVTATSFTGSIQGTATSASYVQLANIDGFTAYSASVNTAIDSVLDATTPLTATVNTTNSPFTVTSQSIVIIDSTNGDVTVNLPDLDTINGTPDQKPILLYKNDYSQNVVYVQPSGSQLVNGTTQDLIVSLQIGIVYNPTSAGWVTEGTSYQSLAELELFFVPRTETGSLSVATASYVEYSNVANKPALVSGSAQITYSGLTGIPSGIVSGSAQIASFGIFATTGSNGFNGNQSITGSLTVTGQVVAQTLNVQQVTSSVVYSSGSNIFGNELGNTQQFTGSVGVTGSLTVAGALSGTSATFNGVVSTLSSTTNGFLAQTNTNSVYPYFRWVANNRSYWAAAIDNGSDATFKIGGGNTIGSSPFFTIDSGTNASTFATTLAVTGSAAFSSSVTANQFISNATNVGDEYYFIKGNAAVNNNFSIYAYSNYVYFNAYNSINIRANNTGGSGGTINLTGGNVGIGYNSPNYQLQVLDTIGLRANSTSFQAIKGTYWGYSTSYPVVMLGDSNTANFTTVSIGYDPSANANGAFSGDGREVLFRRGAQFVTPNAANTAFNLTNLVLLDGNVGIGTASPVNGLSSSRTLNIYGASGIGGEIVIEGNSGGNFLSLNAGTSAGDLPIVLFNRGLRLGHATSKDATGFAEAMRITSGGNVLMSSANIPDSTADAGNLYVYTTDGPAANAGAKIMMGGIYTGATKYGYASISGRNESGTAGVVNGYMTFATHNNTGGHIERMRITSAGYLKVSNNGTYFSTTNPSHEFNQSIADWNTQFINTHASVPYGIFLQYSAAPNNSGSEFLYCRDNNGVNVRATIRSNGGLANYQANDANLSDERVKKDISPLESYWDKFKAIEIVKFKYKDQTHDDFNIGVIAQQVEAVAPEFVDIDGWNTKPELDKEGNEIVSEEEPLKSIYTADLHHATIKVLQECMSKIEEQQSQIEILKAEIQTLKQ